MQLGIFAKYWQAGAVKTRLAAAVGPRAAAAVYQGCVVCLSQRFAAIAADRTIVYTPTESHAEFVKLAGDAWNLDPQAAGDLGCRMQAFFSKSLAGAGGPVVLIGSDSPTLPVDYIEQAFEALARRQAVLGPSDDGGYYLIGMQGDVLPIFEGIEWSSSNVYAQTIERLRRCGASFAELPPWYDVDELADLERLQAELNSQGFAGQPWTGLRAAVDNALAVR